MSWIIIHRIRQNSNRNSIYKKPKEWNELHIIQKILWVIFFSIMIPLSIGFMLLILGALGYLLIDWVI